MDERRINDPNYASGALSMNTAAFFAERRGSANFKAFDRIMRRKGGEPPSADDVI